MICSKCGNEVAAQIRFCGACGAELPSPSSSMPAMSGGAPAATGGGQADGLLGSMLEGKYRLEAKLGVGGMGTVYRATRLLIGDAVAIKILHPEQVADPQSTERFRREAQAAARLKHPNAVNIYDFGVSPEGLVYLVMELVEGQSLRSIIKGQGALTPAAAAEIMQQACAALDEAHRQHIVHRDLKPDNIIVNPTNDGLRVKVLDFGIAKMRDLAATAGNLTQAGNTMGTPHYMSPEQCLGEELDHRSDIYGLGVVLYEMLVGVVPFNSPTSTAVIVQHVNQVPPPLRALNVSISPAVEAVVLHALQKQREARPQTAGALAQEMRAALSGGAFTTPARSFPGASQSLGSGSFPGASQPLGSGALPAATMQPTMVMRTPQTGSAVTGAPRAAPAGKAKAAPMVIAAAVLLLALGGVAAWWFLSRDRAEKKETTETKTAGANLGTPAGMAYVPGGEFLMGNDAGEVAERPAHKITVKPFFIDLYEVSCEEYQKFVLASGRRAPPDWNGNRHPVGAARRPVTGVNWDDAAAYAAWRGKRLPTESEWEFAARGAEGRRYPWGNEWKPGYANADASSLGHMSDGGAYASSASPFGLFDMVGNAWEWTASDLTAYPGGQLPPNRITDELKVIRGGCYKSSLNQATTTFRLGWPARGDNYPYAETGFRCAKDAAATANSQTQPMAQPAAFVQPSPIAVVPSIREFDFRNFTHAGNIRMNNGKYSTKDTAYKLHKVVYGDLTGDDNDEAVVLLNLEYKGAMNPSDSFDSEDLVYTWQDGRPVFLAKLDAARMWRDYEPYVNQADADCDSRIWSFGASQIANRQIVVQADVGGKFCQGPDPFKRYAVTMSYVWNGSQLALAGKPLKKKVG
jgi:eukaryotic-like serine/threonine-protein kinase